MEFKLILNRIDVLDYELVKAIMSFSSRNECMFCHLNILDAGNIFGKSWTKGSRLFLS